MYHCTWQTSINISFHGVVITFQSMDINTTSCLSDIDWNVINTLWIEMFTVQWYMVLSLCPFWYNGYSMHCFASTDNISVKFTFFAIQANIIIFFFCHYLWTIQTHLYVIFWQNSLIRTSVFRVMPKIGKIHHWLNMQNLKVILPT